MTQKERQRIKNYYEKTQYRQKNISLNTEGLFKGTVEVFNPLANTVRSLSDAVTRGLGTTDETIKKLWENNTMELFARKITREMYLYSEVFVEVIKTEEGVRYEALKIDDVEYEIQDGKFTYVKIKLEKGEREYLFKKGKVVKTEQGKSTPFILSEIPVIRFSIDSNILEGLNLIDAINETEAFIRKILSIQGMPVLHASNVETFADINSTEKEIKEQAQRLKDANYSAQAIITTQDMDTRQANFKYIELTNPLISDMQAHIKRLEERYYKIFPESSLVDASNGAINSSEITYTLKSDGLRNKIANFRLILLDGMARLDRLGLMLSKKQIRELSDIKETYFYTDVFERQDKIDTLEEINKMADILNKVKDLETDLDIKAVTEKLTDDIKDMFKKLR